MAVSPSVTTSLVEWTQRQWPNSMPTVSGARPMVAETSPRRCGPCPHTARGVVRHHAMLPPRHSAASTAASPSTTVLVAAA